MPNDVQPSSSLQEQLIDVRAEHLTSKDSKRFAPAVDHIQCLNTGNDERCAVRKTLMGAVMDAWHEGDALPDYPPMHLTTTTMLTQTACPLNALNPDLTQFGSSLSKKKKRKLKKQHAPQTGFEAVTAKSKSQIDANEKDAQL